MIKINPIKSMETKVGIYGSHWISVKERLPDDGVDVLITDGKNRDVSFCQPTYYDDSKEWFIRIYFGHFGKITHWQPLPEPPK